ncbi:hypothetical protein HAX54_026185, partial [Datura stramonium]|nr:hypothetical protein [Datura stramonium]
ELQSHIRVARVAHKKLRHVPRVCPALGVCLTGFGKLAGVIEGRPSLLRVIWGGCVDLGKRSGAGVSKDGKRSECGKPSGFSKDARIFATMLDSLDSVILLLDLRL